MLNCLHLPKNPTSRVATRYLMPTVLCVTAPPDKGKANKAVIAVIADWAQLPKSVLSIAAGGTDRHKSILITGNIARLEALIASFTNAGKKDGEDH